MSSDSKIQGIVLLAVVVAANGCEAHRSGKVGQLAECETSLDDYLTSPHRAVSPVTLVDASNVEHHRFRTSVECCPDPTYLDGEALPNGRLIPQLSTTATWYPWNDVCLENQEECDTCNLCPFGVDTFQGMWTDPDRSHAFVLGEDGHRGDVANLIEFDGNTVRWRAKNRRSGFAAEYRGYYYCPNESPPTFILTYIHREQGGTCPQPYENMHGYQNPDEPFPDARTGDAIRLNIYTMDNGGLGNPQTDRDFIALRAYDQTLDELQFDAVDTWLDIQDQFTYCHPGEFFGMGQQGAMGPVETYCPDVSEFFDCWNTEGPR